jgi:small subunit ribosomal protein S6
MTMTTTERKQLYEGMYILHATLSQDAREKALNRITEGVTQRGGEIVKVHDMGRRKLAYGIGGRREGHYYVIYFEAPSTIIQELWQEYHHNEDLMRFITLKADQVLEALEFRTIVQED